MCTTNSINFEKKWEITTNNSIRYINNQYIVMSKTEYRGYSAIIDIGNGEVIYEEKNYIESAIIDGGVIYYTTPSAIVAFDIIKKQCVTLISFLENDLLDFSRIYVYSDNLIFATGKNIFIVDKKKCKIISQIESDKKPILQVNNYIYFTNRNTISQFDCDNFEFNWVSEIWALKIQCGHIDTMLNILIDNNYVYYVAFDECDTMSSYVSCISNQDGKLIWYRKISGTLDYINIVDSYLYIVDFGTNGGLYKLSTNGQTFFQSCKLPDCTNAKYIYKNKYLVLKNKIGLLFMNIYTLVISYQLKTDVDNYYLYNNNLLIKNKNSYTLYNGI